MSFSLFAQRRGNAASTQASPAFEGDWFGAEAWVVAAGLAERHAEADREVRVEDAASDWLPL
ncbi:hypothetical protein [Dokdonella immobilis]|uniref:Uncharacterized protein n=1 Tax=Dokdonella immobilis TaxID=578942 RepID=A0A1I4XB09_9GAMM|nr:hypothetical protein [Dokdonella immobilis]SFN22429.1 hypothetical protein SAMN05216289_108117 [Dokdonella immobilis]